MALNKEEQDQIRDRIRRDLEASRERGKSPSDPRKLDHFEHDETRLQQIERLRREIEDEYFSQQPDYVQYVNRYGVTKWVLEEELHQKRLKSRMRRANRRRQRLEKVRNGLLYLMLAVVALSGYRIYTHLNVPPVVMFKTNVDVPGMVFVNTELSPIRPNKYGKLAPGTYAVGIASPGYRTAFREVTIKQTDTTIVSFVLEVDSAFRPDNMGHWRQKFPPPRPDESVTLTALRSLSTKQESSSKPQTTTSTTSPFGIAPLAAPSPMSGGVFITSNQSDATIYMNGSPTPLPQNTMLSDLPLGQLTFEVRKPGYRSNPAYLSTRRTNPSERVSLAFELIPDQKAKLTIRTEPIIGEIKFDGIAVGRGSVNQEPSAGSHTVTFGDVIGFVTPSSQVIEISDRSSEQEVVGHYRATVDIDVKVDESGRIKNRGILNIQTGYWTSEKGMTPSQEYGPEIVKVKPYDFFAYQFGPGRPNANPSGCDYVEVTFNLPTGFDADRALSLILEGYATNRNFQFNLTKLTEIAIMVNGQTVHANIRPSVNIDETRTVARDAYPISRFLKPGANSVVIRLTEDAKCYYLLRSMRIE